MQAFLVIKHRYLFGALSVGRKDDDEHEDESSISEFSLKNHNAAHRRQFDGRAHLMTNC